MNFSIQLKQFIKEHAGDDLNRLLLSASRYPEIDIPFVIEQIASRRQIREKLPTWYENDDLIFPAKIAAEQCSSEQTALYKQRLVDQSMHICDLTGGLGIDSYYFSRKVRQVTFIERFPNYCEVARHNFTSLSAENIKIMQGDSLDIVESLTGIDAFYIDPARRGESNKRVFALQDCEPDLPALLPVLIQKSKKIIAKLSPMADIQQTLELLPGTTQIHILSVKNECKELLFVIERCDAEANSPIVNCINFTSENKEECFVFKLTEEKTENVEIYNGIQSYLYEPNSSILKAGAFKSITRLGAKKIHINSHLYTSPHLIENFPGRSFMIEEVIPFNSKSIKSLYQSIPQANITIRNFPLTVEELRKRTKIKDGSDIYVFATTLSDNQKVFIKCRKV